MRLFTDLKGIDDINGLHIKLPKGTPEFNHRPIASMLPIGVSHWPYGTVETQEKRSEG
jgi:hypothetical protein